MPTFPTTGRTRIVVYNPNGTVDVRATETSETTVELVSRAQDASTDDVTVTCTDAGDASVVTITFPGVASFLRRRSPIDVHVTCPERSDVTVTTTGAERSLLMLARGDRGNVRLQGVLGSVEVGLPAADVAAQVVEGSLTIKTASGDLDVDTVRGAVKVHSVSGDVRLGTAESEVSLTLVSGDADLGAASRAVEVTSVSGDLTIGDAKDGISASSTSGDVVVRRAWNGRVKVSTVSGDITVGVPAGRGVGVEARSMSGELRSEIDLDGERPAASDGDLVSIQANSVSGDVVILRAATQPV